MKKFFVSVLIAAVACAAAFVGCADPAPTPHECKSVCTECGKCTNADCTDPACAEKCPGHNAPTDTYTVSFVTNTTETEEAKDVEAGTSLALPKLRADGKVFAGWFESEDFGGEAYGHKDYKPSGDVTLYAKWATPTADSYFKFDFDEESDSFLIAESDDYSLIDEKIDIVIPLEHEGKAVTGIKTGGITLFESATSITIGSNITYIELCAFAQLRSAETLHVDPSNEAYYAEGNCLISKTAYEMSFPTGPNSFTPMPIARNTLLAGTKNAVIPKEVETIGCGAFQCVHTKKAIEIPSTVKTVGQAAFLEAYDDDSLELDIVFPEGVEIIESDVFMFCNGIETVTFPASLKSLSPGVMSSAYPTTVFYNGTRAQWNKLIEGWTQDQAEALTVRCSDEA